MGKITVKHYINKDLKPIGALYPLYIQIIYNRKVYKIKSFNTTFEYINNELLEALKQTAFLESEAKDIERTILNLEKQGNEKITAKNISLFAKPFTEIVDENFCKIIKKSIPEVPLFFTSNRYKDIKELMLFLDANYKKLSEEIYYLDVSIEKIKTKMTIDNKRFLGIDFYNGEYLNDIKKSISEVIMPFDTEENIKKEEVKILNNLKELIEA